MGWPWKIFAGRGTYEDIDKRDGACFVVLVTPSRPLAKTIDIAKPATLATIFAWAEPVKRHSPLALELFRLAIELIGDLEARDVLLESRFKSAER